MNKKYQFGIFVFLLISGLLSLFASAYPDGLEYAAEQLGFIETAKDSALQIIPDYAMPGIANEQLATTLAGVLGSFVVFGCLLMLGKLLTGTEQQPAD